MIVGAIRSGQMFLLRVYRCTRCGMRAYRDREAESTLCKTCADRRTA